MAENNPYFVDGLKVIGDRTKAFYINNRAHIFTGLSMCGTVLTGILSAKNGMKSARKIDRKEYELGRRLTTKEKIRLCWKDHIDSVLVGGLSCFSSFRSDQINTRTIADRTALLIASEKAYEKLSEKTKEVLGEKKAKQVQDEIAREEFQKVVTEKGLNNAPRVGNGDLYPFLDRYSGILFYSNIDYIKLCVMKLQKMMDDLAPRGGEFDYYNRPVGVRYSEWLSFIGVDEKEWNTPERKNNGWNKGFAKDGSDDDEIEFVTSSVEYKPGFSVTVINWNKDPTDMSLGRLIKSSGV